MAVVEVIWRGRLGRISESKVDTIELLQGQTMDIPINSLIPNIAWRPKDPASHQERITIDVRVRTVAYYPFASPLQFPFAPPRRKRLELIVERP